LRSAATNRAEGELGSQIPLSMSDERSDKILNTGILVKVK